MRIESIFRPSDSSEADEMAPAHAAGTKLRMLHFYSHPDDEAPAVKMPADIILPTAGAMPPDPPARTTDGFDGFPDARRGTASGRVWRRAHRPIANLTVGTVAG